MIVFVRLKNPIYSPATHIKNYNQKAIPPFIILSLY